MDPMQILETKIYDVGLLLHEADVSLQSVEGVEKLKRKLQVEMELLLNLKDKPISVMKRNLVASNLVHFRGLLDVARKNIKREVDLVVDDGAAWVKVISKNVRSLAMDFVGASASSSRSITEQALDYVEMARNHPYFFKVPKIIFEFVNGVPDLLRRKLVSFGINVDINGLVKLPADFDLSDGDTCGNCSPCFLENSSPEMETMNAVNLDISSVFVLISSLTHGSGANLTYSSRLLNAQATLEREKPALPFLLKVIDGKRLLICQSAYNAVESILSTVAGPEEKKRAKALFAKIIFGSGDYYKAVTVTANRHFVHAAANQGIHFAAIIHESRALSEKKQIEQGAVRAVRFNVDGNYCLSCGTDKSIKLWNPYKGTFLKTYTGTGWEVLDVQGSSDNSMILSGGRDKQLTIFDVETGKITRRWKGHNGQINAVAFSEESTVAISGCQDGVVRCFDVRDKNAPIQNIDEATDAVLTVDVNSHEIASGSADGSIRIYNVRDGKMVDDFLGGSVTSLHFSNDGQCLLVSTKDGFIRLLDKINGQLLAEYTSHVNSEYRVESSFLATDAHVVSGSEDSYLYIWSLIDMKVLHKLPHPNSIVHSVSVHPKKPSLLSASTTNIFLWGLSEEDDDET
ncbi:unnamed protein product [Thelazia callipaeda]|uniref:WD repeat domain-containing protein 83 n=1 Tax=Thelazia callipaeda TaxID=103827 RepID=A0A158RB36_THECL|nr:unnamed protein product [Thelazia callipaeda]